MKSHGYDPDVIILNTVLDPCNLKLIPPDMRNSTAILIAGLIDRSYNIDWLPKNLVKITDSAIQENIINPIKRIKKPSDSNKTQIIGISADMLSLQAASLLAQQIKKLYSDTIIIGGGPAFLNDSWLEQYFGGFDGYCVGHCESFLDSIPLLLDGKIPWGLPGMYFRTEDGFKGSGISKFPNLKKTLTPSYESGEYLDLDVGLRDFCPNECYYCSSFKKEKFQQSRTDFYLRTINYLKNKTNLAINLIDNNPLMPCNRKNVVQFFRGLEKIPKSIFLDPSLLIKEYDTILQIAIKNNIRSIFMGMETVDADVAKSIGRCWYKEPRNKKRLEDEYLYTKEFIGDLSKYFDNVSFTLSYLATPFDTKDTNLKTLHRLLEFANMESPKIKINLQTHVLTPQPGTKLRKQYIDLIDESLGPSFHNCDRNIWLNASGLTKLELANFYFDRIYCKRYPRHNLGEIAAHLFRLIAPDHGYETELKNIYNICLESITDESGNLCMKNYEKNLASEIV